MTVASFAKLTELPPRDAWPHEARDFTPWLSENVDQLSDVIGVPLELTGTEVAVENFSADILARNPIDDSIVLIENQLQVTDHTHLGQIMTYLAGLGAHTVIWIAPDFRQPHLTAVHWLNEHTADGFSFFAVRLRVVRIKDSPIAPIFEVVVQPDEWSRKLAAERRQAAIQQNPTSETRLGFWTYYSEVYPQTGITPKKGSNSYFALSNDKVRVSLWIGQDQCGIYVLGKHGDSFSAHDILLPHIDWLAKTLGASYFWKHSSPHLIFERHNLSYLDEKNWPEISAWMEEKRTAYIDTLETILSDISLK
jgi:hypothetical protein